MFCVDLSATQTAAAPVAAPMKNSIIFIMLNSESFRMRCPLSEYLVKLGERESVLNSELCQRRAETLQLAAASFSFGLLLLMLVANLFEGTAALGNGGFIAALQGFFD